MTDHEWRLSGIDACQHAFRADGGYINTSNLIAVVPLSSDDDAIEQFFGPYEAFSAECGHVVPVAMLLPVSAGPSCTPCLLLSSAAPPTGLVKTPSGLHAATP